MRDVQTHGVGPQEPKVEKKRRGRGQAGKEEIRRLKKRRERMKEAGGRREEAMSSETRGGVGSRRVVYQGAISGMDAF